VVEVDPTIMEEDDVPESDHDSGHVHDEHCGHDVGGHVHDEHCGHDDHGDHDHSHSHAHTHNDHCATDCHEGEQHHDHGHDHHDAEVTPPPEKRKKKRHNLSLVSSVGYTVTGMLDVAKFNQFMSSLLAANAANLYRTKGVLAFDGQGDTKFVFQGVHEQINFGPTETPWQPDEARVSKLVFIGKNLMPEELKASIIACTTDPATAVVTMHKRA
jgi:G3E family GTPase